MSHTIEFLLIWGAVVVAIPVAVVFLETVAAILRRNSSKAQSSQPRPAAGILMPAHNESGVIQQALAALMPHLRADDQLLVIADNCTDDTAAIARQFPVTVVERSSDSERGKGYALAHGLNYWGGSVPEVVVIMDADCHFEPNALDYIVSCAAARQRPAQAVYLMECPIDPTPRDQISAFAFLFKNQVRPLGLYQLGQPCLLTGTGMAFPKDLLTAERLATGNIVEDMQLGLDLAVQGYSPILVPGAFVRGQLPKQSAAAVSQRTRWEHGHIQTLLTCVPRLFLAGLRQRRMDLIALAFEMCVPPLSLLVMLWLGTFAMAVAFFLATKLPGPLLVSALSGILLLIAIMLAWLMFGQKVLSGRTLLCIPLYVAGKLSLYRRFVTNRQKDWVRTRRDIE
ncbi:MAG: glycosyltransferase [Planctomycetales bacterium]|nr:glycosyltransferase [Planctomycetales bacterium]